MKTMTIAIWLLISSLLGPVSAAGEEVRISAAASLTDAVKSLTLAYRQDHQDVEILLNFAPSGTLAKQIAAGAPADIYISANPKWMDHLRSQSLVDEASLQVLLHNRLVVVGWSQPVTSMADLTGMSRIALATPSSAPAGRYAEQAMQAAGLHGALLTEGKLVPTRDVRQALLHADRGEVDGAFVYRTDALLAQRAVILFEVPQELYPQVVYPAALTISGAGRPVVRKMYDYLTGAEASKLFAGYGFLTP
ncbi:MAG TPA: molybdate ABC transporter substrate-binding protein [Desulfuromonadales bacterium]|nr:molybdate ABC transporter substrate-binding protein [Desulfuromonadales bacterium]